MENPAKELFLELESSAIAPDRDFSQFEVGRLIEKSFISLRTRIDEIIAEKQHSALQVVIGKNGNGKTLLANKVVQHLAQKNSVAARGEAEQERFSGRPRRFEALYSQISALGQVNSQTNIEIAAGLRRSQYEEPEFTYSLLATQIAKKFDDQYRPHFVWKLGKAVAKAGFRFITLGMSDDLAVAYEDLEKVVREGAPREIKTALDSASTKIQKRLSGGHYKREFQKYLGELNEFDPFVKTYFFPESGQALADHSVHVLRKYFLDELNKVTLLPKQVVEQIGQVARKVDCKLLVIIIDDCNQESFILQMLPLINDLQKMTAPRVFLIVNMVQHVADKIRNAGGDRSAPQRLFYGEPIVLTGPGPAQIEGLFGKLCGLYNDAFASEGKFIEDSAELRAFAVREWQSRVANGSIEDNYRSAISFMTGFLRGVSDGSMLPTSPNMRPPAKRRVRRQQPPGNVAELDPGS